MTISQPFRLKVPSFTEEQMRGLAETGVGSSRDRITRGVNVADSPARQLRAWYARIKERSGKRPVRDLTFTGATLRAMEVVEAGRESVEIGFSSDRADRIAQRNEVIESMFGLSPSDEEKVNAKAEATFMQNLSQS